MTERCSQHRPKRELQTEREHYAAKLDKDRAQFANELVGDVYEVSESEVCDPPGCAFNDARSRWQWPLGVRHESSVLLGEPHGVDGVLAVLPDR